ncbi:hypothetical protein ACOMHN_027467 [Nucella lapillus]
MPNRILRVRVQYASRPCFSKRSDPSKAVDSAGKTGKDFRTNEELHCLYEPLSQGRLLRWPNLRRLAVEMVWMHQAFCMTLLLLQWRSFKLQEDNTGVGVEGHSAEDAVGIMEDQEESVEAQNQDMEITEPQTCSKEIQACLDHPPLLSAEVNGLSATETKLARHTINVCFTLCNFRTNVVSQFS